MSLIFGCVFVRLGAQQKLTICFVDGKQLTGNELKNYQLFILNG